jgi:hypothetical protein
MVAVVGVDLAGEVATAVQHDHQQNYDRLYALQVTD